VSTLKPDLVVCYENAALRTFAAARTISAVCVLDAASVHYNAQRSWRGDNRDTDPASVGLRKEREITAADAILTCSRLAAQTYREAGVQAAKLFTVALGTALPRVRRAEPRPAGPRRFVFVGSVVRHKGIEDLSRVFAEFAANQVPAQLTVIGPVVEHELESRLGILPNIVRLPFVTHPRLFEEVARQDCLILPSLFDSFGMVVPEAMAVGVPAIVSERVGAKCIIEDHPGAGWIVPCDRAALKAQILALVRHRELLDRASGAARQAAADYTWENYRKRVVRTLEAIYEAHRQ
jgi:glycosyltransferase involved in cell wall biosynthesis